VTNAARNHLVKLAVGLALLLTCALTTAAVVAAWRKPKVPPTIPGIYKGFGSKSGEVITLNPNGTSARTSAGNGTLLGAGTWTALDSGLLIEEAKRPGTFRMPPFITTSPIETGGIIWLDQDQWEGYKKQ
jgi:hypothetical protein